VLAGVVRVSPEDREQIRKDSKAADCWMVVLLGLLLLSLSEIVKGEHHFLPDWVGWAMIPLALFGTVQMLRYNRRLDRLRNKKN
jgi:hypothetical protein